MMKLVQTLESIKLRLRILIIIFIILTTLLGYDSFKEPNVFLITINSLVLIAVILSIIRTWKNFKICLRKISNLRKESKE